MHAAARIAFRHLLVQDAAACGHPLDVAGAEVAFVPEAVAVRDGPGEHVRDRFDAAVRMPREPGEVILRVLVAEVIEQQKRIELVGVAETEGTAELHTGALESGTRLDDSFDRTNGHRSPLSYAATACGAVRRSVRFTIPPTTAIARASHASAGVHSASRPASASSEYAPGPVSASAAAPAP